MKKERYTRFDGIFNHFFWRFGSLESLESFESFKTRRKRPHSCK